MGMGGPRERLAGAHAFVLEGFQENGATWQRNSRRAGLTKRRACSSPARKNRGKRGSAKAIETTRRLSSTALCMEVQDQPRRERRKLPGPAPGRNRGGGALSPEGPPPWPRWFWPGTPVSPFFGRG